MPHRSQQPPAPQCGRGTRLTSTPPSVLFLRTSLIWLVVGVTLGLGMAMLPAWVIYRAAHIHMLLLGFVTE